MRKSADLVKRLKQFQHHCPYLQNTSPSQLRELAQKPLATAADCAPCVAEHKMPPCAQCPLKQSQENQLTKEAWKCPVMSKALSLQTVEVGSQEALQLKKEFNQTMKELKVKEEERQKGFDYDHFYKKEIDKKLNDKSYRYFNNINRLAQKFPKAHTQQEEKEVMVWCSNDYLGMSKHPIVIDAVKKTLDKYGAGAGGTRNIAGNGRKHLELEESLADLHGKDAALLFSSCFVANDATLSTLCQKLPDCVIFSDSSNHASMIQGIRHSGAKKYIFRHNDVQHLESLLQKVPLEQPKLIAFESVYSMCGSIGPLQEMIQLAKKYNAITFLDEVHAVGMYGHRGAGVAELDPTIMSQIDIITGTLGKAYGLVGGYIAGNRYLVDMIRSYAPGFIFTTALPPSIAAGAFASVEYLKKSTIERTMQQLNTVKLKRRLAKLGIPVIPNPSHIVPVLIGNAEMTKKASDLLLEKHHIYVQGINYPTVSVGEERLRITPTPGHTEQMMDDLCTALESVWDELGLWREEQWFEAAEKQETVQLTIEKLNLGQQVGQYVDSFN